MGFVNIHFKWALRDVLSCKEDCDLQVRREIDVTAAPWLSRAPPNLVLPSNLLSGFSGLDTQRWLEAGVLKSRDFTFWTDQAYGYAHDIRYTWSFILLFLIVFGNLLDLCAVQPLVTGYPGSVRHGFPLVVWASS